MSERAADEYGPGLTPPEPTYGQKMQELRAEHAARDARVAVLEEQTAADAADFQERSTATYKLRHEQTKLLRRAVEMLEVLADDVGAIRERLEA